MEAQIVLDATEFSQGSVRGCGEHDAPMQTVKAAQRRAMKCGTI